jgi:hypothetical protein
LTNNNWAGVVTTRTLYYEYKNKIPCEYPRFTGSLLCVRDNGFAPLTKQEE